MARASTCCVNLCPGETFESLEAWWLDQERERPRAQVTHRRSRRDCRRRLPTRGSRPPASSARRRWRTSVARIGDGSCTRWSKARSPCVDSRGYGYAEVTAGGIPLDEIDPATMQSRVCPGLYLVGEILDVDGRLGGFNFQWAWSSGWVAGHAIAKALVVNDAGVVARAACGHAAARGPCARRGVWTRTSRALAGRART